MSVQTTHYTVLHPNRYRSRDRWNMNAYMPVSSLLLFYTHWFATSAIHAEVIIGRRMRHHFTKISSHSFQMGGALHINVSLNPPIFAMKRLFWYASHILYCNGCGCIGRETSLLNQRASYHISSNCQKIWGIFGITISKISIWRLA